MGARVLFHKIRLKPGKPMLAALLGRRVVLGLPGNPVSSYLNALLFLPVAMAGLQGASRADPWKPGRLEAAVANPGDRPLLHPCRRQGDRLQPLDSGARPTWSGWPRPTPAPGSPKAGSRPAPPATWT